MVRLAPSILPRCAREFGQAPALALTLAVAFPLTAGGCGAEPEKPAPSGERTVEPVPETPKDAPKGPFASFDFEAAADRWQGAWVVPGSAGHDVAWAIDGSTLIESDGVTDKTYEFAVYSPCQVTTTDAAEGVTTYHTFTFAGPTLHTGLGAAGVVITDASAAAGETIIACVAGKTYVLTGTECGEWSEMFDDWKRSPADCKVEGAGETRTFVSPAGEVPFVGTSALANTQMQGNVAHPHADFAAAKAALARVEAP